MTRRELLALLSLPAAGATKPLFSRSQLGVLADEVAPDLPSAIAFAKKYGVPWMELRGWRTPRGIEIYERLPFARVKEDARRIADAGLRVSVLDSTLLKFRLPGTESAVGGGSMGAVHAQMGLTAEKLYQDRIPDLEYVIEVASILGTNTVRTFTFLRVDNPATVASRVADVMNEMAEVAALANVNLLVEPEAACNVASSKELAALFQRVPSKAVSINWDPENSIESERPFPDGYRLLPRKRISNIHVKFKGLFGLSHILDWPGIFRQFSADGYKGRIALETHLSGPEKVAAAHASMREILRLTGIEA